MDIKFVSYGQREVVKFLNKIQQLCNN
jgi:hypothetical protein